ncbi:LexA family protein [Endozoicomonas euniceicola]|uniref:Helix-turn-helix domain-containing protein n=1 Tax=Endozoicomonas euniceicola TaxID=1234143 RepID=A0ABY6GQ48_9GAMM|nr:S24 family peptidase [Endozoicomonas euniceicola]UYM14276.1 helix-turn-helix domain-containing protein [Endozoicomonas euniceicola]
MSIGDRIIKLRKEKGWSQGDLAREIFNATGKQIRQQSIGQIETGKTKNPRNLEHFANAFGVSESYLRYGGDSGDTGFIRDIRFVPLISWVSAGQFCEVGDIAYLQDPEDLLPCPGRIGPRSYALKVKGDSMTNPVPSGMNFPEGTFIYVDPDIDVVSGKPVIARLPNSNESTFKIYVEDSGKKYLKPLNPQYPIQEIQAGTNLCGVVVGQYTSLEQ